MFLVKLVDVQSWRQKNLSKILWLMLVLLVIFFCWLDYYYTAFVFVPKKDPLTVTDNARLYPKKVEGIYRPVTTEDLRRLLALAGEKNLKVSIRGSGHSQGGHTISEGAMQIDMRSHNKVLTIDTEKKEVTVEAGATWDTVQREINEKGLAIETMQSSNIFTVGGTLSANAHGRDLSHTTFVESVDSFRLMKYDGEIVTVSRTENRELFKSVIGGYGLFGVILDVTLRVIPNDTLMQVTFRTTPHDLLKDIQKYALDNEKAEMFLGRPSFVPGHLFEEIIGIVWEKTDMKESDTTLTEERNVIRDKFIFGVSRAFDFAKTIRWKLQKDIEMGVGDVRYITRNNSMRPPMGPLTFLEYESPARTDILQEYYIPTDTAEAFITDLKETLESNHVNVISTTIRYVRPNDETLLAYTPTKDAIAVIFMANVSLDTKSQDDMKVVVQKNVTDALRHGGTYYLTYQLYPTKEQLREAYPNFDEFIALKKKYDPQEMFSNNFYETYK